MHDHHYLKFLSAWFSIVVIFIFLTTLPPPTNAIEIGTGRVLFTNQDCNFTAFPKSGCEDELGAECTVDGTTPSRCRCKPGHDFLVDGRFCFPQACPPGHYYDFYGARCVAQRRASSLVAESHCRYDYHCLGPHVRCVLYGWNRNCVCNPGFVYGYNGTCIPLHGIGGHCSVDGDCDSTGSRKMFCEPTGSGSLTPSTGSGTCQCMTEHTYNYQVDGCESNERIRERRSNMRTLIVLFVLCACVFGFALTFNFGLLGSPNRAQQAMLLKRIAMEKERAHERALKEVEEGLQNRPASPSAPPPTEGDGGSKVDGGSEEKEDLVHLNGSPATATDRILVVDLDMIDNDVIEEKKEGKAKLISLY